MNNVERDLDNLTLEDTAQQCAEMGFAVVEMLLKREETCFVRMFGQLWELSMKKVLH